MERFYVDPARARARGTVMLDENETRHLLKVKRRAPGDTVVLFDGQGGEYAARLGSVQESRAALEITDTLRREERDAGRLLCAASAVPKGKRLVTMVEKLTELGVDRIRFLTFARSVRVANFPLDRLRRVAVEASKQSGRLFLPDVLPPAPFEAFLDQANEFDVRIFGTHEHTATLPRWRDGTALYVVGPEGGFAPSETDALAAHGFVPVRVGENILRIETAAAAICAALVAGR